ncbi:MAG: 6-bladed beta-propeller [Bacteroidales bacterium]|jgi:hypothetical protein|nr:6-bladed beta-propeller [Bacteroidales bacterium]
MKKIALFLSIAAALSGCCNRNSGISFQKSDSIDGLARLTSSIELVPLESDSTHLLGAEPELFLFGKDYITADKMNCRIYRYSSDGRFLNSIGAKGNGPGEYANIADVQITGDSVFVFSGQGKMAEYDPEGTLISSSDTLDSGMQSYIAENGILTYYGYGSGKDYRMSYKKDSLFKKFLDTEAKVLNFSPGSPVFSKTSDGDVAILDSYNPVIYKFKSGTIEPYLKFDFGKYAIQEAFFKYDDAFKAMQFLLSTDFAIMNRYFENTEYKFAEITTQSKDNTEFSYGLAKNDSWKWFYAGKAGKDPLATSFRTIDDHNTLFCIIDPALADKIPDALMKKVSNPDIIKNIKKDDNYIIAKIHLL